MDTLVQLKGNHSTLIRGLRPIEVAEIVTKARQHQRQPDCGYEFVYLQAPDVTASQANRIAVDPFAVVGVIGVGT